VLHQRSQSKQAKALDIMFWSDVIALLKFDSKDIAYLSSFDECVDFFKKHFCKLDTAIRNLYTEFLNNHKLLEPFQELYKVHVTVFLDKWFNFWSGYKENQTGTLQRIIDDAADMKVAVIVGDGVAYEIAEQVAAKVKPSIHLKKDFILGDLPSETENNMSRIYMDNGVVEAIQSKREKYLIEQNPDVDIDLIRLDEVTEDARPGQFLICTYKDIDDMGEKLQQKALKYFSETINFFAAKISQLLDSGYGKVYLISDHGFVLTGLLSESDKISVTGGKSAKVRERYISSDDNTGYNDSHIIKECKSGYMIFAKNMNPFKSVGNYGFSHGGATPQELITPFFCWERSEVSDALPVTIENKLDLKNVTGELFPITIQAEEGEGSLFSMKRKVYLVFFANKAQVHKSDVFMIKCNDKITKEYTFDGHPVQEVHLLDATTKQLLDKAIVKQNNDRDLGGLL
jgi:hypothetical protein